MKTNPVTVLIDNRRRLVLTGASLPAMAPNTALRLAADLTLAAMQAKAAARRRAGHTGRIVLPAMGR